MRIAGYYDMGYTPEEIAENYRHITPAQVYVAIAYYYANKELMDQEIADEQAEYDRLAAEARDAGDGNWS